VALAKAHGYDHVINYRTENFVERVKELTQGEGVDVVYDSVGRDTYMGSLDVLKPLGMFACFGQSSGTIPPFDLNILAQKGSLFATRPTLFRSEEHTSELQSRENLVCGLLLEKKKKIYRMERIAGKTELGL